MVVSSVDNSLPLHLSRSTPDHHSIQPNSVIWSVYVFDWMNHRQCLIGQPWFVPSLHRLLSVDRTEASTKETHVGKMEATTKETHVVRMEASSKQTEFSKSSETRKKPLTYIYLYFHSGIVNMLLSLLFYNEVFVVGLMCFALIWPMRTALM